jgi:hypothetical protein
MQRPGGGQGRRYSSMRASYGSSGRGAERIGPGWLVHTSSVHDGLQSQGLRARQSRKGVGVARPAKNGPSITPFSPQGKKKSVCSQGVWQMAGRWERRDGKERNTSPAKRCG